MAIRMASVVGVFYHHCCFAWDPGSRQGDTEQLVAQWWRPEAAGIALDMLHRVMHLALHPCLHMAIEMTSKGGAFFRHC